MTRNRRIARAFTLVEAIVVILIIGVLSAVIAPRLIGRVGQGKHAAAESNASVLAGQMRLLHTEAGEIPDGASIDILWERPPEIDEEAWSGPYVGNADELLDPWGNQYILVVPADKNIDFDVVSYGRDGAPGGEGEDEDIVKP